MVEAALIYPLVMILLFALLYMMLFLYSQTVIRAEAHLAVREAAGAVGGMVTQRDHSPESLEEARASASAQLEKELEDLPILGRPRTEAAAEKKLLEKELVLRCETEDPMGACFAKELKTVRTVRAEVLSAPALIRGCDLLEDGLEALLD